MTLVIGPRVLSAGDPVEAAGYRLIARLGSGGFGVVYLGLPQRPPAPGTPVTLAAVKQLHPGKAAHWESLTRFRQESEALRRCRGARVPELLNVELADPERPFIATRFIPAPGLDQVVRRTGPLSAEAVTRIGLTLATTIRESHRREVLHRDLKPPNVLLDENGPWVIDFGLARLPGRELTRVEQGMGTPSFAAPEQLSDATATDGRTDVFGLGALLLFALTGHAPYQQGGLPDLGQARRFGTVPIDLTGLPDDDLGGLIRGCLAEEPARRPPLDTVCATLARLGGAERLRLPRSVNALLHEYYDALNGFLGTRHGQLPATVPFRVPGSWQRDPGDWLHALAVCSDGRIATADGSGIVRILASDSGQELRTLPDRQTPPVRLLWYRDMLVVSDAEGRLRVQRPDGSQPQWAAPGSYRAPLGVTMLGGGDTLVVSEGNGTVRALSVWDGVQWWSAVDEGHGGPRRVVTAGENVIYALTGRDAVLQALDAEDGAPLWSYDSGAAVLCPPVCAAGWVVVADSAGRVSCLADDGTRRWHAAVPRGVLSAVWEPAGGTLLLGDAGGAVHALDPARHGRLLWSRDLAPDDEIFCLATHDGIVYAGGWSGLLHALDAASGSPLQCYELGGQVLSVAAGAPGTGLIHAITTRGRIHAMPGLGWL